MWPAKCWQPKGHILLAGEISAAALPDVGKLTRDALENAGYDPKDFEIQSLIHPQSPDIEAAINDPLDTRGDPDAIGAGDQCVVVGYATDETPELLPLPVVLAHRLTQLPDAGPADRRSAGPRP